MRTELSRKFYTDAKEFVIWYSLTRIDTTGWTMEAGSKAQDLEKLKLEFGRPKSKRAFHRLDLDRESQHPVG
jgi:hypothetical protein